MHKQFAAALSLIALVALAACGSRDNAAGGFVAGPVVTQNGFEMSFAVPVHTIGEELPGEGVGTEKDPTWGTVGGFTQTSKAQVLAFPPNTVVTIRNLSHSTPHTLNVVGVDAKPPANFPANPSLSTSAHGNGHLALGYASGILNPGKSVKVVLSKAGTYLIGCAFHYHEGMQGVLRVNAHATPGPQGH